MGIRTIAVFSEPDRTAPHVLLADESYCLGPAPSGESYLRQDAIIDVARTSGAEAIHPGYGFLSENAEFARRVKEAGLVFIGPPPEAIQLMGDKTSARKLMIAKGVPVVPGTEAALSSLEEARVTALQVGYPVLIKAAAGGGGKGMRVVETEPDLEKGLSAARNEARVAFGDDRVYIEKFVLKPRHIEIQVLADAHGNIIHLGERECSVQRRHQKVVEESPSSVVDADLRARMGEAAVNAARACGYVNAGTVEFLVDANLDFYFLEMNTRLQVEHPVTEMVTGIDLVKAQIRVAEGQPLPYAQADIVMRGHAIEARISAEDVRSNFLPSTGTISVYRPSQGFGVRDDSGVATGSEISIHYDPMFAKLIAWGTDRPDAIAKLQRALADYRIIGVETTIPFCRFVLSHPAFTSGDFNNNFVQEHYRPELLPQRSEDELRAAALAAVLLGNGKGRAKKAGNVQAIGVACSPWVLQNRGYR